ncbi:MAG: MaoC family dehydratase [Deltaproteobacteria bacterium]|nr:MaoC family dehydratase [Deltaproteobacteria bacterium]
MPEGTSAERKAYEAMQACIGKPIGPTGTGPDPVNQPMIRHWAAAFEDENPVYTDPAFAAKTRFGGIVAPPLMLQTWTMPTPKLTGIGERGGSPTEGSVNVLAPLDEAGFVATLATNSEFEVLRYLRLGESVSTETILESVSERKRTRLGPGHFVTWVTTYRAGDEVVGRQMFRMLKFKPDVEALLK